MSLEYNLNDLNQEEQLKELKLDLAPRNQCREYVLENRGTAHLIEKREFDELVRNKQFVEGPFKDAIGDGYGDPYNPNRQAFGTLKDGRVIYCELSHANQKKVKNILTFTSPQNQSSKEDDQKNEN